MILGPSGTLAGFILTCTSTRSVDESLARLGVDYVDVIQVANQPAACQLLVQPIPPSVQATVRPNIPPSK